MPDDLAEERCATCRERVFTGAPAVSCLDCGLFHHRSCWTRNNKRCGKAPCKSSKCTPVAVVRLQPPGPTAQEVAAATLAEFERVFHPVMSDLRADVAHREDVEKLRARIAEMTEAAERESRAASERAEKSLRQALDAIAEVRRAVTAVEDLARTAAGKAGTEEISEISKSVVATSERSVAAARQEILAAIAELGVAQRVETRRNLLAIEACRWDTAARRKPLPWEGSSDDVVLPAAAPDSGDAA